MSQEVARLTASRSTKQCAFAGGLGLPSTYRTWGPLVGTYLGQVWVTLVRKFRFPVSEKVSMSLEGTIVAYLKG